MYLINLIDNLLHFSFLLISLSLFLSRTFSFFNFQKFIKKYLLQYDSNRYKITQTLPSISYYLLAQKIFLFLSNTLNIIKPWKSLLYFTSFYNFIFLLIIVSFQHITYLNYHIENLFLVNAITTRSNRSINRCDIQMMWY